MTDNADINPLLAKEKKGWLSFLLKVAFVIGTFVLISVMILGNMGGNSDTLKNMIEEFASESTSQNARIKTLHNVTFFPSVSFDFEDMSFYKHAESKISIGHIDRAQVSFGFWDIILGRGRVRNLNIVNVRTAEGAILRHPVTANYIRIIDTQPSLAVLESRGNIGPETFQISIDMESSGAGKSRSYAFATSRDIVLQIGDVELSLAVQNAVNPYIKINNLLVKGTQGAVLTGALELSNRRAHELTVTGEMKIEKNGTVLRPDLVLDLRTRALSGTITSDNFNAADFDNGSLFAALTDRLVVLLGSPEKNGKTLDEFWAAQSVTLDLKGAQGYQGKLAFENNRLSLASQE